MLAADGAGVMRRTCVSSVMALGLLLLGARPAAADGVQSWTEIELGVLASARVAWTVGGVARVRDALASVYDRRVMTDVEFAPSGAASLSLGYVLLHRTRTGSGSGFGRDHRLRAALTYPLLRRGVRMGRRDALRASRRPAGRRRLQPLPPAGGGGASARPGVAVALPVGGLRTPRLRAVPIPRRVPLAFRVRAFLHGGVPVRAAPVLRGLAAAARRPVGMESRLGRAVVVGPGYGSCSRRRRYAPTRGPRERSRQVVVAAHAAEGG